MYYKLNSFIKINNFELDFVTDVTIQSSWDMFTDTASIVIPKRLFYKTPNGNTRRIVAGADAAFKRGDLVDIQLGYDNRLEVAFSGFLSNVYPKQPIRMECEDEMWTLKKTNIEAYSKKAITLDDLLYDISPIPYQAEPITLGYFRIADLNVVQVLEYIKKTYGLISYIRDHTLYCGFPYITENRDVTHTTKFGEHIVSDDNLQYKNADDISFKVKVISIDRDNNKYETEVGDPKGDLRTLYLYDVAQSDIERIAAQEIQKFKYDGFTGSFTKLLEPIVRHGDKVNLVNDQIPDQNGTYFVKQVDTIFGQGGGRQEVFLDRKL